MFGIPSQSREIYSHNFIRSVNLRATYPSTSKCSDNRARFKDLFSDVMPKVEDSKAVKIELNSKGSKVETSDNEHRIVLHSDDMQKEMAFSNEDCQYIVSGEDYKSFDAVSKQFEKALFFAQTCGVHTLNALTVRKINVVQFNGETTEGNTIVPIHGALRELVGDELIIDYDLRRSINPYIRQSMQTIVLQDQGYELTIKYGVEALQRENDSKKISGIVVIDLLMKKNQLLVDSLEDELNKFNNEIFSAFRWVLTDTAVKLLNNGN